MKAQETHFLDNGYVFNIPPVNYRRRISIPLIMAVAPGGKSKAKHGIVFNGAWVTEARAEGTNFPNAGPIPETACNVWNGYIQPNEYVSIQAVEESSHGGYALPGITVLIGAE
ncbi:TPA: hypothetical protein ACXE9F_001664 [Pluralibacter gergoviae]